MLKVGIVGSGFGMYGLLPAFAGIRNCKVTCICGKQSQRLLDSCKKYKVKNIYTDWQKMLKMEDLDALAIAVPPNAQYQIAKQALKQGLSVFAEKPLALSVKQAAELVSLAKKHKAITAVDFIFPEIPQWKKAKQLLSQNKIGKLLFIKADWDFLSYDLKNKIRSWKTDVKRGGGALSFFFSHVLYYLEYFGGQITDLQSSLSYSKKSLNGGEAGVDIIFQTQNQVEGSAHLNCAAEGVYKHSLMLVGEKGALVLENSKNVTRDFILKIYKGNKTAIVKAPRKNITKELDERVSVVHNLAGRFVQGCLKKKSVRPSMEDGLRVQVLINKIRNNPIS